MADYEVEVRWSVRSSSAWMVLLLLTALLLCALTAPWFEVEYVDSISEDMHCRMLFHAFYVYTACESITGQSLNFDQGFVGWGTYQETTGIGTHNKNEVALFVSLWVGLLVTSAVPLVLGTMLPRKGKYILWGAALLPLACALSFFSYPTAISNDVGIHGEGSPLSDGFVWGSSLKTHKYANSYSFYEVDFWRWCPWLGWYSTVGVSFAFLLLGTVVHEQALTRPEHDDKELTAAITASSAHDYGSA
eukprot:TRINITY_DN24647_c0_g1_i1.p1 TRINITY_DN24647_c0_g1~~TRINITY_DN24647_c0_g1_i1.p1  ORF type:complete len:247 (-),score=36.67 TRINITY_DN24647_c0_g1_i1:49-789(-)